MNSEPLPSSPDLRSYCYHDPEFVAWWLQGLYPFKVEQQVHIATLLHEAVNDPEVQAVIVDFVAMRQPQADNNSEGGADAAAIEAIRNATVEEVIAGRLKRMWSEQRNVFWVAGAVAVFLLARGVGALLNAVQSMIA